MPLTIEAAVFTADRGICHTDLGFATHAARPAVLSDEDAGIVQHTGAEVSRCARGDRVALTFFSACEQCPTCLRGHPAC